MRLEPGLRMFVGVSLQLGQGLARLPRRPRLGARQTRVLGRSVPVEVAGGEVQREPGAVGHVRQLLANHVHDRIDAPGQLLAEPEAERRLGRLDLDDDGVRWQLSPVADDRHGVVDVDHVHHRCFQPAVDLGGIRGIEVKMSAPQGRGRIDVPGHSPDEDELRRPQLLETVQDERRGEGQILHHHAVGPLQLLEIVDELPTEIQVPHPRAAEAGDQGPAGRHRPGHPRTQPRGCIVRPTTLSP
jgi:hypothetical protein